MNNNSYPVGFDSSDLAGKMINDYRSELRNKIRDLDKKIDFLDALFYLTGLNAENREIVLNNLSAFLLSRPESKMTEFVTDIIFLIQSGHQDFSSIIFYLEQDITTFEFNDSDIDFIVNCFKFSERRLPNIIHLKERISQVKAFCSMEKSDKENALTSENPQSHFLRRNSWNDEN